MVIERCRSSLGVERPYVIVQLSVAEAESLRATLVAHVPSRLERDLALRIGSVLHPSERSS